MTEALQEWKSWNEDIASGRDLPPGFKTSDQVFINCGSLSCGDGELTAFERATVDNMEARGHHGTQLINNDASHVKIAEEKGLGSAMNPFSKKALGVLDTTGGLAVADKACRYALHKAKSLGVKFILGPQSGSLKDITYSGTKVTGLETADGKHHPASMVILACGGWTPSLLPSMDGLCETTAGSVIILKIPEGHPLRERFHHSRFPSYMYKFRDGAEGGIYGFPVDENGYLKIGYRGIKYTNPQFQADGKERSVPVTRWTPHEKLTQIPEQAYKVFRGFLDTYMPELGAAGIDIWMSRVCWYTDSYDNHFVVDRVPGREGLMVATGGSGHGFKFLPNLGRWVVDVMEGKGLEKELVRAWAWRERREGESVINELMQGREGERALGNVKLVTAEKPKSRL